MKWFIVAVASLLASGCVTEQPATGEELQKLQSTCQSYGFQPGSSQYSECLLRLDENRVAVNRERRLRFSAALSNFGNQIQANARNQQMINAMNRPMQTRCYRQGYYTNCTSY